MKTTQLRPSQIIALNDYPLYSNRVLSAYVERCRTGEALPFVPVIGKGIVRRHFGAALSRTFAGFEAQHSEAAFFLLDGSHRTTALTLVGRDIGAAIYETDGDIDEARRLIATGQILPNATLDHTLEENCEILNQYFVERPYFMTVRHKTEKMVREALIPGLGQFNFSSSGK